MARRGYIGVENVARKLRKSYLGVDNIARRIKKAYIGIGGLARPCWSSGVDYYGSITPLQQGREDLSAATVGDWVIFAGGSMGYIGIGLEFYPNADAYNKMLTRISPSGLSKAVSYAASATVGDHALFIGGRDTDESSDLTDIIYAYDSSLTIQQVGYHILPDYHAFMMATSVGGYVIYGGGIYSTTASGSTNYDKRMFAINESLTTSTLSNLSKARLISAATTIGDHALFGGGYDSNGSFATVEVYDSSLARKSSIELSAATQGNAATTVGDHALFGGGYSGTAVSTVDVFTLSLTRIETAPLSVPRNKLSATTVGDYALFGGGSTPGSGADGYSSTVDAYDKYMTLETVPPLSVARTLMVAATVGDYALFAGGRRYDSSASILRYSRADVVDAYTGDYIT